ncbi:hypothetical protein C4J81_07855 [Deltaproteobacteria bacterium Smac51]|nr:hypothetical protein C4J81_07855 [Deltaproteobacteria bacterium Smac51]
MSGGRFPWAFVMAAIIVLRAVPPDYNLSISQGGIALNTMMAAGLDYYGKEPPRRGVRALPGIKGLLFFLKGGITP